GGVRGDVHERHIDRNSTEEQTQVHKAKRRRAKLFFHWYGLFSRCRGPGKQGSGEQEKDATRPAKDSERRAPPVAFDQHGRKRSGDKGSATDAADGNAERDVSTRPKP